MEKRPGASQRLTSWASNNSLSQSNHTGPSLAWQSLFEHFVMSVSVCGQPAGARVGESIEASRPSRGPRAQQLSSVIGARNLSRVFGVDGEQTKRCAGCGAN